MAAVVSALSDRSHPEGILARQARRESSARTYPRNLPLALVRGEGIHVTSSDGRTFIDCLAGAGTLALGHNHPVVVEAVRAALDRGLPLQTLDLATPVSDELVTELLAELPPELARGARIQFCGPSGADAVEAAWKLAKTATGRRGLLAFSGGYHGMTHGALAATGAVAPKAPVGGLAGEVQFLPFPSRYRCPLGIGSEAGELACAGYVERLLEDPSSGVSPPAGMLLEVVQGEGGVLPAPDRWLRTMRRLTAAHGIPLIVDEVQTGFGRTGRLFAFEHAGVVPDVLVLSKALGGGLPLPAAADRHRGAGRRHRRAVRRRGRGRGTGSATGRGPVTVEPALALEALLGDATPAARAARRAVLEAAAACLDQVASERQGPYSGASPEDLAELVAGIDPLPAEGAGVEAALRTVGTLALRHAVDPAHPATAAHLHCAPLHVALAGELLAAAANPSLDSWDQAPVATHLEQRLVLAVAAAAGYDPAVADGVLTSGGTQSNLQGLLLARDRAGTRLAGRDLGVEGLGGEGSRWRVLCSEAAHFSVWRSAALLGLGHRAVVPVAVDSDGRMRPDALDRALEGVDAAGLDPVALVATTGTTDFGAIDPLPALSERARDRGLWLHVDAAVGGALLFSERHRGRLEGLAAADSIAVDFHKLLWQPLACGLFLVRDRAALAPLGVEAAYLNADESEGEAADPGWRMPHLVGKSLATSRRFDALKVLLTFQALGRRTVGALLDRTLALAARAAELVRAEPALALAHRPGLNMVVFRYVPPPDQPDRSDRVNAAIRTRLLAEGAAVVGRTRVGGRVHLKLTLLNPCAGDDDLAGLVARIARTGADLDEDHQ